MKTSAPVPAWIVSGPVPETAELILFVVGVLTEKTGAAPVKLSVLPTSVYPPVELKLTPPTIWGPPSVTVPDEPVNTAVSPLLLFHA